MQSISKFWLIEGGLELGNMFSQTTQICVGIVICHSFLSPVTAAGLLSIAMLLSASLHGILPTITLLALTHAGSQLLKGPVHARILPFLTNIQLPQATQGSISQITCLTTAGEIWHYMSASKMNGRPCSALTPLSSWETYFDTQKPTQKENLFNNRFKYATSHLQNFSQPS